MRETRRSHGGSDCRSSSVPGHAVVNLLLDIPNNTPAELRGLPCYQQVLYVWFQPQGWRYDAFFIADSRLGGLGYLWPGACLPAIAGAFVLFLRRRREEWKVVVLLMFLVAIPFLLQPMYWWPRYTIWLYALGLPCFAALVTALTENPSWPSRLARFWLEAAVIVTLVEGWNCCYFECTSQPLIDTSQLERLFHNRFGRPSHELLAGSQQSVLSGDVRE